MPANRPSRQRGVSLIEALIAFLVTAFGMLALAGMQATLRLNSDIAKQRTEAVRLAQLDLEGLRDFSVLQPTLPTPPPNEKSFAAIVDSNGAIPDVASNTTYTLDREVIDNVPAGLKTLSVTVTWPGRNQGEGVPMPFVVLHSLVAEIDPASSSVLALSANGLPLKSTGLRIPNVPMPTHDLGDGRSVFKPTESGTVAWVFNNANGVVTSRCFVSESSTTNTLTVADLSSCTVVVGRLLTGYVRFSTDGVVTAAQAEQPASAAKNLDMTLALGTGGPYPDPGSECFDNAPTAPPVMPGGQTAVGYFCLVYPNASTLKWSGRLTVTPIGWAFGTLPAEFRLCRYSADYDDSHAIDNPEHPAVYTTVDGNLANQNFLVVRGDVGCPTDVPADPDAGDLVDSSTVQHEPPAP